MESTKKILRCSSSTDANKLAASIYSAYMEDNNVSLSVMVIGAGSLNQAVKASILSNKYFSKIGVTIGLRPSFHNAAENVTAIKLKVLFMKD